MVVDDKPEKWALARSAVEGILAGRHEEGTIARQYDAFAGFAKINAKLTSGFREFGGVHLGHGSLGAQGSKGQQAN
jgi:hypothetical protein